MHAEQLISELGCERAKLSPTPGARDGLQVDAAVRSAVRLVQYAARVRSICCGCFVVGKFNYRLLGVNSVSSSSFSSSSLAPPSSWSWASVVYVVCSCVVGWGVGCLSQVVSLGRSLLSLLVLVGCRYALMSSSHLLAGLPCFRYPFCLVDIAGFQLEISCVQFPSWCLASILACFQYMLLCSRIHSVTPVAANKSSVLCFARTV